MRKFSLKETLSRIKKHQSAMYSKDTNRPKPFYNLYPYKPSNETLKRLRESVKDIKLTSMKVENINYTDESGDWYQLADQPTEYNILPLILGIVAGVLLGSLFI